MKKIRPKNGNLIAFLLVVLFFTSFLGIAQELNEENSYYIRQYKETEANIASYFQDKISSSSDTLLAVFVPPMGCPRCEGTINLFISKYNDYSPNNSIVFVFGGQNRSMDDYLRKRDFKGDLVVVDNSRKILDNFKFSSGDLTIPYFLNIDARNGKLLNYAPSLGINLNDDEIKRFLKDRHNLFVERKDRMKIQVSSQRINLSLNQKEFVFTESKEIILPKSINNENIKRIRLSEDGMNMSFINRLNSSVIHFGLKQDHQIDINTVSPTAQDENRFIDSSVSDTIRLLLKKLGIINTMYLNAIPLNNGEILVSASLPKVEMKVVKDEESVEYHNKATLIKVTDNNLRKYLYYNDSAFLVDSTKSFLHKDFYVVSGNKNYKYLFPIHKGWPVVGNDKAFLRQKNTNPFSEDFYKDVPLFAAFDNKGRFVKEIGVLDEVYERLHVGYYYSIPMVKSIPDGLLIADQYTGNVGIYSGDSLLKKVSFFDNSGLEIYSADNKIEEINSLKDQLHEKLTDFAYSKNNEVFGIIDTKLGIYLAKFNESKSKIIYNICSKTSEKTIYKSFIRSISEDKLVVYLVVVEGGIMEIKSGYIDT